MKETTVKLRHGFAEVWARVNPILADGEPGVERDTGLIKVGNGVDQWNRLPYSGVSSGGTSDVALNAHVISPTPHPVYDDGPSLTLLYQNKKV